jgi:SAM-dependent methyltransferase
MGYLTSMMSLRREGPEVSPPLGQPGRPRGVVGRLLGWVMARDNDPMNALAVELLDPQPGDRVLEVGFGPGRGLERLAERVPRGSADGVDHAELMVEVARRRNRRAVGEGRVRPRLGSLESLPWADATFDGAMAVNNHQFWPDPVAALHELGRVLRPGGRLVLAVRVRHPEARTRYDRIAYSEGAEAALHRRVRGAGLEVRQEVRRLLPGVGALALAAVRPERP